MACRSSVLYDTLGSEYSCSARSTSRWATARRNRASLRIPVDGRRMDCHWSEQLFGPPLVFVSPDGHVAWRGTRTSDPQAVLRRSPSESERRNATRRRVSRKETEVGKRCSQPGVPVLTNSPCQHHASSRARPNWERSRAEQTQGRGRSGSTLTLVLDGGTIVDPRDGSTAERQRPNRRRRTSRYPPAKGPRGPR